MSDHPLLGNLGASGEAPCWRPQRHSSVCEEESIKPIMGPLNTNWPRFRPPKVPPYDNYLQNLLARSCIMPHPPDPESELFRRLVHDGEANCLASQDEELGLQGTALMQLQHQRAVANLSTQLESKPIPKRSRECSLSNQAKEHNAANGSVKRRKSLLVKKEEPISTGDDKGRFSTSLGGQATHKSSGIKAKTPTKPAEAQAKSPMKPAEVPKTDYIHVRARRGQATDSHSLAERVRREKISQRMRFLQDLVPGCSKITGKAMMLDEIINYVQSLQHQVEFLAMKLAALNPNIDFGFDSFMEGEIASALAEVNGACPHMVTNTNETQCPSYMELHNLSPFYNLRFCDDEDLPFISDVSTDSLR